MDLDEVADELYAVPPDQFVAVRGQRQDDARAAGNRTLAREIGAVPKPTAAAWVCNLLVREQRAEIEGLVELGDLLRQAQESLAGDQLRALDRQRSQLLTALTRQATALAREHGVRVGSTVETQVADTLRAALADPEAGQALLSGRLTGAMSYSGLGTTGIRPALRLVRPRPEQREAPATRGGTAAPRRRSAEDARRAAEEEARRREGEARRAAEERRRRELEEARAAAEEATALAAEAVAAAEEERHRVDDLDARRADLQARVEELADELARTEEEAARTAEELQRAELHRRTAERHATEAAAARDHALAALRALEEG
ncbi:hypothetical protein [Geodermatophilus obscurus]|uniref:Uncharacterized protein n=1 Tax=Geodermatophilus obscurus (strain ATCC 25078 / DSM 43160 / JCM 3152 / CCUG 61914 / KCC A-0152 / KCTC 9177 / NBRC 13315 / NRRL B-3577 / G-20) TaxID=526225 RepID=D2SD92_GEOOG|nr:hypothetical protein [Geodermatophilus obscurus]ADB76441.1 conserved hypothetical protein [Geodermatophilus obscurus DSM 43160]